MARGTDKDSNGKHGGKKDPGTAKPSGGPLQRSAKGPSPSRVSGA